MNIKMNISTELHGEEITTNIIKNILWRTVNACHRRIVQDAPVDQGSFKNSIHIFPTTPGHFKYTIADGVKHGAYIEFGTHAHVITPKNKKALAFEWTEHQGTMLSLKQRREAKIPKRKANIAMFKSVMHPGTPANPVFRRNYDITRTIDLPRIAKEDMNK